MERCALIVEHHVVGARNAHDETDARSPKQHQQRIHVVLIGLGMVRVANVAAERQAEQFAAEMIFKAGADDLLAVVEIFRADKADDCVDEQRLVMPRQRISAGLAGLLIDAEIGIGRQCAALSGLEIHDVIADSATFQR